MYCREVLSKLACLDGVHDDDNRPAVANITRCTNEWSLVAARQKADDGGETAARLQDTFRRQ